MKRLYSIVLFTFLMQTFIAAQMPLETKTEHNPKWQWFTENNFRVVMKCPKANRQQHKIAWAEMDFSEFYANADSQNQIFNPNSIRVVEYDKDTGKPIKYDKSLAEDYAYYVPAKIDEWPRRYLTMQKVRNPQLSWIRRENDAENAVYICYFDFLGSGEEESLPKPAFIGSGDALSFGQSEIKGNVRGVPLIIDWDGDGYKDIITSVGMVPERTVYFYKNNGNSFEDGFGKPISIDTQAQQRYEQNHIVNVRGTQVTDVNGDGNMDIVGNGGYYSNVKVNGFAKWVSIDFPKDCEIGQVLEDSRFYRWYITDWDGDGVNDLIISNCSFKEYGWSNAFNDSGQWTNGPLRGWFYFYKNIGDNENFNLIAPVQLYVADGNPAEVYGTVGLAVEDFTGNGLPDIIAGDFIDNIYIFKNIGSKNKPLLAPRRRLITTDGIFEADYQAISIAAADYNNNGYKDLFIRGESDYVGLLENTGEFTNDGLPVFKPVRYLQCYIDYPVESQLPVISIGDWNNNGKDDIIFGNSPGYIGWYERISEYPNLIFSERKLFEDSQGAIRIVAGWNGSIQGPAEKKWGYTVPTVGDWDGDGYPDIMLNSIWGHILWYQNPGVMGTCRLEDSQAVKVSWDNEPPKPVWRWWNPEPNDWSTQWRSTVQMIDWDGDGLMDVVAMDWEGYLVLHRRYMENGEMKLSPGERIFLNDKGEPWQINPRTPGGSGRRKFVFADWNNNGKWDFIVDDRVFGGNVVLYINVSDNESPMLVPQGPLCDIIVSGHTCSPAVLDLEGNGKLDLLLAAEDGHFYCFHRSYIEDKESLRAYFVDGENIRKSDNKVVLFDDAIVIGQIIGGQIVDEESHSGRKSIYAARDNASRFNVALDFRGNINILQNRKLTVHIKTPKTSEQDTELLYVQLYTYVSGSEGAQSSFYYPRETAEVEAAKFTVNGREASEKLEFANDGSWQIITLDLDSGQGLPQSNMAKSSTILRRMDFVFRAPAELYIDNVFVSQ